MNKNNYIKMGLFFGGILGLFEATFGYILHLLPSGVSGAIMYPILFAVGMMLYKSTESLKSVYIMTMTATCIKLTNLAIPFLPAVKVLNPAMAILLEGLSVALIVTFVVSKNKSLSLKALLLGSYGWRGIYLMYITSLYFMGVGKLRMFQAGPLAIAEFLSYGVINAVIIYVAAKVLNAKEIKMPMIKASTLGTACTIGLAIGIQIIGA